MGGSVAQRFAIDRPDRTAGLVLMGSFARMRGNPLIEDLWRAVSILGDPIDPAFIREFQKSTLARSVPAPLLETVVGESGRVPAPVWKALFAHFRETDLSGELQNIAAPTLIAWGDQDSIVPRQDQDLMAATIPAARLVVYSGAGHGFHWEDPAQFASDLVAFAAQLQSTRFELVQKRR
jgi:pimeloyl-ACP methyl ester carboxylesterase